uniref:G_PROTEIN_RECEP_F1_2 domain-containing protein n=1 Tax=Heligmosomoides polygyrus TaxID=6339 RepID=A0A183GH71_HELPZ
LNKQRLKPNLITRYNIDENIRTLAIVMPFCLASCIFGSLFIATDAVILLFNYTNVWHCGRMPPRTANAAAVLDGILPQCQTLLKCSTEVRFYFQPPRW